LPTRRRHHPRRVIGADHLIRVIAGHTRDPDDGRMLAVSTAEVVVSITLAALLFVIWFISIFLVVLDDISVGGKISWSLALIFLAPISVPAYLFLRHRRHSRRPETAALDH
jgi:hypothetical protein